MGFELAQVIAELGEGVVFRGELKGGKDGLMDLAGAPSAELSTTVEEDFHEAQHAGVLDLDAGDFGVSGGDGQSQALEQREVDMDIQGLGLELSETVGDGGQGLTDSFQIIQGFLKAEILQVVAEDL